MTFRVVATLDDFWEGEMRGVKVGDCPVLLVHTSGEVTAFADRCVHQGVALSEGRLVEGEIVCAAHEWRYDASSGRGTNPASARLTRFPVRIEGRNILVDAARSAERK